MIHVIRRVFLNGDHVLKCISAYYTMTSILCYIQGFDYTFLLEKKIFI